MKMRTFVGLCAALAFGVGSTAVHALKFVNSEKTDPTATDLKGVDYAKGTITYAKETLRTGAGNTTKGHYNIVRDHFVSAQAEIQGAAGDGYIVTYTLDGMVFVEVPKIYLSTTSSGVRADPEAAGTKLVIASGGAKGDTSVVLRKDKETTIATTDLIVLDAIFSVSENGGTIRRVVINRSLEDLDIEGRSKTRTATVAVKPALKETVKPMEPTPVAKAAFGFTNFGGSASSPVLHTSLGTIEIGVVSPNLRDAEKTKDDKTFDVSKLEGIAPKAKGTAPLANPVTFSGNFDFVDRLALSTDCSDTETELRVPSEADPMMLTDETTPTDAEEFKEAMAESTEGADDATLAMRLCLVVDGETAIPSTATYKVTTSYKGRLNAAFPPAGGESELARIKRDGTTFRIPYLTTADGYNQRIVIVNRGNATTYTFGEFEMEEGVTVAAGTMANGDLPEGTTVLRVSDVVDITGSRTRASGTLSIVAHLSSIDAAIQQVNTGGDRSVDTVYLTAEDN